MENIVTRIGRLLGLRLPNSNRTVRPVPQSQEVVPPTPKPKMKQKHSAPIIAELKAKGLTYKQIGHKINLSRQRVHQIYHAHLISESSWTKGLSVRNQAMLNKLDITSREQIVQAINDGRIKPRGTKNYGIGSYTELVKWAGINP